VGGVAQTSVALLTSNGAGLVAGYLRAGSYLVTYFTDGCRVLTVNANSQALLAEFTAFKNTVLAGRFPDGTAELPSISFENDSNTGIYRSASDVLAFTTGGVVRGFLSTSGLALNVPLIGNAVTSSSTDNQSGKITKVGDGGLLGYTPVQLADTYWSNSESTRFIGGNTNSNAPLDKPVAAQAFAGIHVMRSASHWIELVTQITGTEKGAVYVRANEASTTSPWQRVLMATEVATTTTDANVGRLSRIGDYGLGAVSIPLTGGAQLSARQLRTGFYTGQSSNIPDLPDLAIQDHTLLVMSATRGADTQRTYMTTRGTSAATLKTWLGTNTGTGTVAWSEVFHQNNIVGTVTQVLGVPTGAILQRGTNANGEFVRLADGTQICWGGGTTSASAELSLLFPAAFISTTTICIGWECVCVETIGVHVPIPRINSVYNVPIQRTAYVYGETRIAETDNSLCIFVIIF
jgi:hypothetical protein